MRYLLDTNIISDLIRNPNGDVASRIRQLSQNTHCTSIIVAAELGFGVTKKGSKRLAQRVDDALQTIEVLPLEMPADQTYAVIRTSLEKKGRPIGNNDLMIAAHAVALGCILITANEREFSRIDRLKCENWLR